MEAGVPRKALRRRKQGGFYIFDVPRNQTYFYQHGQRQRIIRLQLVSILQGLARHSKIARGQSCGGDSVKFIVRANVFRSCAGCLAKYLSGLGEFSTSKFDLSLSVQRLKLRLVLLRSEFRHGALPS